MRSGTAWAIMLGLVDRSDEVVIGTTERVVKACTVHRMPGGQRGDARYAKSIGGVPWQPNPAKATQGEPLGTDMARIVSVPMVMIEHRLAVPVLEPREYEARRFYIRREVELANVSESGAEANPMPSPEVACGGASDAAGGQQAAATGVEVAQEGARSVQQQRSERQIGRA